MNKQEILKQADYTFQRGNRELAKKYLAELLAEHPNEEAAWVLLSKIEEEKERKVACCQRVLKINPSNTEMRIALARLNSANPTLPRKAVDAPVTPWLAARPNKKTLRVGLIIALIISLFGTTTLVVARNNPESNLARFLQIVPQEAYEGSPLAGDIAPQARAQVSEKYPQYAPLVDTLINYAVQNSENGMAGAPERPGAEIIVSDQAGVEAKTKLMEAIPQKGALTSATITEQQLTSWLVMEMKNRSDLPLSDVQVYLRNGKIQLWGIVHGNDKSTAALITGSVNIDANKQPHFKIESIQIGQQVVSGFLLTQAETWLNQVFSEQINSQMPGLELMNVSIKNGMITVSGMR
jgi:hypothetical protein